MTDKQRQKVYDSEFTLRDICETGGACVWHGTHVQLPVERRFGTLETIQRYCNYVTDARGAERVTVAGPDPGQKNKIQAHYSFADKTIYIPLAQLARNEWAGREIVVLHELAHHFTWVHSNHGSEFCAEFLKLLEQYMGAEVAWILRTLFADNGVQVAVDVVR